MTSPHNPGQQPVRSERGFTLDPFQEQAMAALDAGRSVVVAAPTGSGKTVVAEHAIELALQRGSRAFYTTPIKALSNQKFRDFVERFGAERVGLLTGDNSIRGDADVVVMTTEVLRNMVYLRSSGLDNLAYVVLDEVHYLQDSLRGPVWEEVVIHTPAHVGFVSLSATVSNSQELGDWLSAVRGPTEVIYTDTRPVVLQNQYVVAEREKRGLRVLSTLPKGRPNAEAGDFDAGGGRSRNRKGRRRRATTPKRDAVIRRLEADDRLPAIYFIFSRAGCDDAARSASERLRLELSQDQLDEIDRLLDARLRSFDPDDLEVLGYSDFRRTLHSGVAAHHAGMVPAFKEVVEQCFIAGLLRVVFATETLALGINMPARTVIIEKLSKYNGEGHELLTPGQYTQLTGRAGRRGIDTVGFAQVLWSPFVPFSKVAELAQSRNFELRSAFRPAYNMTVNLIRRYERDEATEVLGRSFAQFQLDRSRVEVQVRLDRDRSELAELVEAATCEHGSVADYVGGGPATKPGPVPVEDLALALSRFKPGDVIRRGGPRIGVLSVAFRKGGEVRLRGVDAEAREVSLTAEDLDVVPERIGGFVLPQPFQPNDVGYQAEVAALVRRVRGKKRRGGAKRGDDASGANERDGTLESAEPTVATCPKLDAHLRAFEAQKVVQKRIGSLERRQQRRDGALLERFDAVLSVLDWAEAVDGWSLTPLGETLAGLHHEADLLVALALADGVFDGLEPGELAALVSCISHESRREEVRSKRLRGPEVEGPFDQLAGILSELNEAERSAGIELTPQLDAAIGPTVRRWIRGDALATVVDDEWLTGGDFVRGIRALIDLLNQIGSVPTHPEVGRQARRAAELLKRDVVASLDDVGDPDPDPEAEPRAEADLEQELATDDRTGPAE